MRQSGNIEDRRGASPGSFGFGGSSGRNGTPVIFSAVPGGTNPRRSISWIPRLTGRSGAPATFGFDSDGSLDIGDAIACGEPQLVVRSGIAHAARLTPARMPPLPPPGSTPAARTTRASASR